MLKTRIMPVLTVKERRLVKSVRFAEHRNIGSCMAAVRVFNARDVDEMVFLDMDARFTGLKLELLKEIARECFMPLAMGGGVKSIDDVKKLLQIGADKVCLNTEAVENPSLINKAAKVFGSQCVVVSVDARREGGEHRVFIRNGGIPTFWKAEEWAREAERRGAGEIFLTSIDRDGTMEGYDVELVKKVADAARIPVIASGGAGNAEHCLGVLKEGGASAIAAASIFQYTQTTPRGIKEFLSKNGIETRI